MLELRAITKRFGEVLANDHIDIRVEPGTIHAIVGENGAGKSTAMRIAYGFYTADSGEILVDGEPRQIQTPHDAIRLGIGMVHQHFMLVETMTVAENIVLGAEPGSAAAIDLAKASEEIRALSNEFRLSVDPGAFVHDLSVGQQQRVELLKALYRHARLLILDEPTAVLTPQEVEEFFAILRRMREQGKTVIIITHKLSEVLAISDDVTVMRDGRVVGRVKTAETGAAELARMMVGRDVLLRVEKPDARPGEVVLDVRRLSVTVSGGGRGLRDVSFTVKAGEIVGVAGVEGNGQTELIEARRHRRGRARALRVRHRARPRRPPPAGPAARLRPVGELHPRAPLPQAGRLRGPAPRPPRHPRARAAVDKRLRRAPREP
jgi:simple sugar transport system ATP-binding protein